MHELLSYNSLFVGQLYADKSLALINNNNNVLQDEWRHLYLSNTRGVIRNGDVVYDFICAREAASVSASIGFNVNASG